MTFDEFLQAACPPLDLQWRKYRRRAARHRLEERLRELGLASFAAYLERLRADPAEAAALADRMRVTVSRFFRERGRWVELAESVLPLLRQSAAGRPLRLWSAGCCGGEEPYSLAILWRERFADEPVEILATDIDAASLERAAAALYAAGSLREVPSPLLEKYFRREGGRWRLSPEVAAMVRLDRHNLMLDPLPGIFDLILCRYLAFTYYGGERRLQAARRLWRALRPGGALLLGAREAPPAVGLFAPWPGAKGIFARRQA